MASIKLSQIHEFALGQHLSDWGDKPYAEVMAAMRGDDKPESDYVGWEITGVVPCRFLLIVSSYRFRWNSQLGDYLTYLAWCQYPITPDPLLPLLLTQRVREGGTPCC